MANLNKVMLIGNLTRDPELRFTPSGKAVAELGLAINRIWYNEQNQKQEETTFVDVTLWARQAEIAQQYLTKGSPVYIEGRLNLDTWDDKATGQKRSKLKVVGETLQLLGSKGGSGGSQASRPPEQRSSAPQQGASAAPASDFQEEDDIPF
ncbi:MAG: single-stranded DNA-binding protein [Gloeobacteraceae cyanobacterium ES-bin-144]|nr:single-stranded DNA-binding protein [Verrucomicrobiales bacterium]